MNNYGISQKGTVPKLKTLVQMYNSDRWNPKLSEKGIMLFHILMYNIVPNSPNPNQQSQVNDGGCQQTCNMSQTLNRYNFRIICEPKKA